MQARLEIRQFPTRPLAIALAMTAALAGGGALGYTLKATTATTGPARVIQVTGQPAPASDGCTRIGDHKAC
jgi:hypothetical protein